MGPMSGDWGRAILLGRNIYLVTQDWERVKLQGLNLKLLSCDRERVTNLGSGGVEY